MNKKRLRAIISTAAAAITAIIAVICVSLFSGHNLEDYTTTAHNSSAVELNEKSYSLDKIPEYEGRPYVVINNNNPDFTEKQLKAKSYESYGKLDSLGRCTECIACIGTDLMPTGERDSISAIKPTGWQTSRYDFVDGESLYNRCHLIAYQLAGEGANPYNLITGTRYMNTEGMLPFEESVGNYVRETNNHVLYRVTPIFSGNELVARGVQMEALSIEDGGKAIRFNVYCYNVQPQVAIDYKTGKNHLDKKETATSKGKNASYVLNVNSKKFHRPDCDSVKDISEKNKKVFNGKRQDLIDSGYEPCSSCNP